MRVGEQLLQNVALNKLNRQRATIQNDRKSPTRECGDGSNPTYKRATIENDRKSPTRECGDGSDPAYKRAAIKTIGNPPHGSVGMVQIQPT